MRQTTITRGDNAAIATKGRPEKSRIHRYVNAYSRRLVKRQVPMASTRIRSLPLMIQPCALMMGVVTLPPRHFSMVVVWPICIRIWVAEVARAKLSCYNLKHWSIVLARCIFGLQQRKFLILYIHLTISQGRKRASATGDYGSGNSHDSNKAID